MLSDIQGGKDEINRRFLLAIQERMGIMLKALDNNVDNIIKNQARSNK